MIHYILCEIGMPFVWLTVSEWIASQLTLRLLIVCLMIAAFHLAAWLLAALLMLAVGA